jgi:FtsH-binding integral membrane protein
MNSQYNSLNTHVLDTKDQSQFLNEVFFYTGIALGISALGAFLAPSLFPLSFLFSGGAFILYALEIILVLSSSWWGQMERPYNIFFFSLFAFISGVTVYPLLAVSIQSGGIELVVRALTATTALSMFAGIYAKTTHRNLTGMYGFLVMSLLGLIVVGILQIFWFSSLVELVSAGIGVVLFTAFIAVKIQIIENFPQNRALEAALSLYLSIFNLFISVLRLLSALNRR